MESRLHTLRRGTLLVIALTLLVACVSVAKASASELEWRQGGPALTEAIGVGSTGTFKLIDPLRSGGELNLSCTVKFEGKVGTGASGEVSNINFTLCNEKPAGECESNLRIELLNLPWHSELTIVGGKQRDLISSGGKGTPGLVITCTFLGMLHWPIDECTGNLRIGATNSTAGVEGSFDEEPLSCKNAEHTSKGTVEGSQLFKATTGATLEAVRHENWLQGGKALSGSIGTKTSGTIKLKDEDPLLHSLTVECKDTGEGTAGTGGSDEMTKLSFSSCKFVSAGSCETRLAPSITAVHLSWHSELLLSEGLTPQTHDMSLSGGKGSPGFTIECLIGGIYEPTDTCTASALKTSAKNVSTGVEGAFDGEKLTCSQGKKATGVLEGTQLIQANTGSALEVANP